MNVKKYQAGGIGPKKKDIKGKGSAAYEKRREESRTQMEADANVVRRQMAINKANRQLQDPKGYETTQGRASSPTYKTVSGEKRGISSAERSGASKGTVGSMTPQAAKRSEAAMKKPAATATPKATPAPARKSGELSPATKAAIEAGKGRGSAIGKAAGEYTLEEARKRGLTLKYGGMVPKKKK
jgi:hypothetical protein